MVIVICLIWDFSFYILPWCVCIWYWERKLVAERSLPCNLFARFCSLQNTTTFGSISNSDTVMFNFKSFWNSLNSSQVVSSSSPAPRIDHIAFFSSFGKNKNVIRGILQWKYAYSSLARGNREIKPKQTETKQQRTIANQNQNGNGNIVDQYTICTRLLLKSLYGYNYYFHSNWTFFFIFPKIENKKFSFSNRFWNFQQILWFWSI